MFVLLLLLSCFFLTSCTVRKEPDSSGEAEQPIEEPVQTVRAEALEVFCEDSSLRVGDRIYLSVSVTPDDAEDPVTWTLSDETMGELEPVPGGAWFTAGKQGNVKVRVQTESGIEASKILVLKERISLTLENGSFALGDSLASVTELLECEPTELRIPVSDSAYLYNPNGDYHELTVVFARDGIVSGFYTEAVSFRSGAFYSGMSFSEPTSLNNPWLAEFAAGPVRYQCFLDWLGDKTVYGLACFGEGCAPVSEAPTEEMLNGYAALLWELTQAIRIRNGLAPYQWLDELLPVSRAHGEDMVVNNFASHTSSDGRSIGDRMNESGLPWKLAGENLAFGMSTPFVASAALLNSAAHRENILRTDLTHGCTAVLYGAETEYHYYAVENFCLLKEN